MIKHKNILINSNLTLQSQNEFSSLLRLSPGNALFYRFFIFQLEKELKCMGIKNY